MTLKKLSIFIISASLLTSMSLMAKVKSGPETGGGGDPLEIEAEVYPDSTGLEAATKYALNIVQQSKMNDQFKNDFATEMSSLKSENKFKLLPAIIILARGAGPQGYLAPENLNKFISLGGMTKFTKGSNIYLAKRVMTYSTPELAAVVLHEILHHVLDLSLSKDEAFVSEMTTSLMKGSINNEFTRIFKNGGDFRAEKISRNAFLDSSNVIEPGMVIIKYGWKDQQNPSWFLIEQDFRKELEQNLPENLANLSIHGLTNIIIKTAWATKRKYDKFLISNWTNIQNEVVSFIKKINPEFSGNFFCKKEPKFYQKDCSIENQVTIGEMLKP
ncbi:MAG: hypothetical protein Q7U04_13195 [Bacteriovorax sp.]|nr:hypothetical protein [Bacteriovorax sp.]